MHTDSQIPRTRSRCARWFTVAWLASCLGCGYPEVSPDTYEIAKALHSAVAQRDVETLKRAAAHIESARDEGRITAEEYDLLTARIGEASAGDWDQAGDRLWELLAAQNQED